MTTQQALLDTILANPDDDTARLVYADWLDENEESVACEKCKSGQIYKMRTCKDGIMRNAWGDCERCDGSGRVSNGYAAMAEFIRVQCELAKWEAKPVSEGDFRAVKWESFGRFYVGTRSELFGIADHEYELWRLNGHVFGRDLPGEMPAVLQGCVYDAGVPDRVQYVFRRGFVESVETSWASWRDHGDAILSKHPVTKVRLTTEPEIETRSSDGGRRLGIVRLDDEKSEWSRMPGGNNRNERLESLLRKRWPSVKEWELPPEPRIVGEFMGYPIVMRERQQD